MSYTPKDQNRNSTPNYSPSNSFQGSENNFQNQPCYNQVQSHQKCNIECPRPKRNPHSKLFPFSAPRESPSTMLYPQQCDQSPDRTDTPIPMFTNPLSANYHDKYVIPNYYPESDMYTPQTAPCNKGVFYVNPRQEKWSPYYTNSQQENYVLNGGQGSSKTTINLNDQELKLK